MIFDDTDTVIVRAKKVEDMTIKKLLAIAAALSLTFAPALAGPTSPSSIEVDRSNMAAGQPGVACVRINSTTCAPIGTVSPSGTITPGFPPNSVPGSALSPPTTVVLGGVFAGAGAPHQFQTGIGAGGAPIFAQPAISDITGPIGGDLTGSPASPAIAPAAVTAAKMATGAALSNLGYSPLNKGGDTATGAIGVPAPAASANDNTADTTANSQNRLSRRANAAALATWTNYALPVMRDDVSAVYADTGASCTIFGGDGGAQVQPAAGHCWQIIKSAYLTPELYGYTTDATAAFQAVATASCAMYNGANVALAPKVYPFAGQASISYSCPIDWEGAGWSETSMTGGTWFSIAATGSTANGGKSLFAITSPSARGTKWNKIGVAETQPTPASGWAATPYPAVFNMNGMAGAAFVHNIIADPVYDLVSSVGGGRLDVCGLYGQVLHKGLFIDTSFDTTHGSCGPIHWWPYWSADPNVLGWTQANAIGLSLGRVDGAVFPDVFLYGFFHGVEFVTSPNWTANLAKYASKVWFGNYYADAVFNPIYVNGSYAPAAYYEPYAIVFDNASMSCAAVGTTPLATSPAGSTAARYSAGIFLESNAAIGLTVNNWNIDNCDQAPFLSSNVTYGSTLRFGSIYTNFQSGTLFFLPSVAQGQPPYNLSVSHPPITNGAGQDNLFGVSNSNATTNIARVANVPVSIAANGTYSWQGNAKKLTLKGAAGSGTLTGITVTLPPHPWDGMDVTIYTETPTSSMTISSTYGVQGPASTSMAVFTALKYVFSAADNSWLPT